MRGIHMLALLASASLLPAVPAFAEDGANLDPKDRMVCKRTQKTGTRFYTKICKTWGQWEAMAEEQRRGLAEQVNRPQQNYQPTRPGE
jgi:hypothetical protein